jgi:chromate transporter
MTPGPIGINTATYVGYTTTGNVWGSMLATIAVCLPSFIIMLTITRFFLRFKHNRWMEAVMSGIKPVTVGLIGAASISLINRATFIDFTSLLIFMASFILTWRYKVHPIAMLLIAGLAGLVIY